MFREIFGPPGLKAGQNEARIESAVPQPKGGGVAARLSGYESEAKRAAVGRELALDDCRPMDFVVFAETRPAAVIIVPPNYLPGFHPVVCFIFRMIVLAASRQTKAVLIRDEREARPSFEVARDFRALVLKTTQAITACNENRRCAHAT
jgi:hypothetical protein